MDIQINYPEVESTNNLIPIYTFIDSTPKNTVGFAREKMELILTFVPLKITNNIINYNNNNYVMIDLNDRSGYNLSKLFYRVPGYKQVFINYQFDNFKGLIDIYNNNNFNVYKKYLYQSELTNYKYIMPEQIK